MIGMNNDDDDDDELLLSLLGDTNFNLYKSCIDILSIEHYKRLQNNLFVFRYIPLTIIQQRNFIIIALSNAQIEANKAVSCLREINN